MWFSNMHARDAVASFADDLIDEGTRLQSTAFQRKTSSFTVDTFVDLQAFYNWRSSCRLILKQLGAFSNPWAPVLDLEQPMNNIGTVKAMIGALESIRDNVARGRLASFEDIVFAEAFANLTEQGEYLLDKHYFVAAGVIFRAVLEERLRRMCQTHGQTPQKTRPTITDYNQALYKAQIYDKIEFKNVDAMAAVGNSAAHNSPGLTIDRVKRFRTDMVEFLAKFSQT